MIDPIRQPLEKAVSDLHALARDSSASIPLWSRERWVVQSSPDGNRVIDQQHPIEKDYQKFFYYQIDNLLKREAVKALATSLQNYPLVREALCLKPEEHGQELAWNYLLPITSEVLRREDAGERTDEAVASVLAILDVAAADPTYEVKYYAPLRNFTCAVDELQLTEGIWIRRIPNSVMAEHLNMLATNTNFHDFYKLEFQLESEKKLQRTSPRAGAVPNDEIENCFRDMEDALRVIKCGAVGILFQRSHSTGFFGGNSISRYSVGSRLFGDTNSFTYKLTNEDIPVLIKTYKALKGLRANPRFSIALRRFTGSYPKPLGDDRVLDYWIALEALVLPDGKEGELRTKAAIRLAWLLGNKDNRKEIFRQVQKSYNLRSSVAHGTKTQIKLEEVTYLESLLREVMLHCLAQGVVPDQDWLNSLVLDVPPETKKNQPSAGGAPRS